jgi:hypothetical protein
MTSGPFDSDAEEPTEYGGYGGLSGRARDRALGRVDTPAEQAAAARRSDAAGVDPATGLPLTEYGDRIA